MQFQTGDKERAVQDYENKRADLVKRAAALHIEIDRLQQDYDACRRRIQ